MTLTTGIDLDSDLDATLEACPIQRVLEEAAAAGNETAQRRRTERRCRMRVLWEWSAVETARQQKVAEEALRNAERLRALMDENAALLGMKT